MSIFALGEIMYAIKKCIKDDVKRKAAIDKLFEIFSTRQIKFCSPQFADMEKAIEIKETFRTANLGKIEPSDALHLACAINHKAHVFVTLDGFLRENAEFIKQNFKIRVELPSSDLK
jgi:predicted nucleic acid-binding protein